MNNRTKGKCAKTYKTDGQEHLNKPTAISLNDTIQGIDIVSTLMSHPQGIGQKYCAPTLNCAQKHDVPALNCAQTHDVPALNCA